MASSEASPLIDPAVQQPATPNAPVITSRRRTILLLLLYLVFLDLGYELIVPAQTRVLERIYCRLYYEDHASGLDSGDMNGGIDERLCKVGVTQSEVAMLNSIIGGFDTLGLTVGSPLLASLFSRGIEMKGFWFGLPFLFSGFTVLVIVLFLSQVNT
ncbi:major facilitator superfamily transporter [Fusarium sp. NRRL 25303]|nr:major facilitator superfamily transporter [Fusarium sp. NRRL 25303]